MVVLPFKVHNLPMSRGCLPHNHASWTVRSIYIIPAPLPHNLFLSYWPIISNLLFFVDPGLLANIDILCLFIVLLRLTGCVDPYRETCMTGIGIVIVFGSIRSIEIHAYKRFLRSG